MRNATDKMGRSVTIISDDTARKLTAASHAGWHEFVGMADGYSRSYAPGTETHTLVTALFDHWTTAGFGRFVVGESAWSDTEAWWVDYRGQRDLHVGATPVREANGSVHFAG
jgi:hypothetical protein